MPLDPSFEKRLLWGINATLAGACAGYLTYVLATRGWPGLTEIATTAGVSVVVLGKLVIFWGLREGAPPLASLAVLTFLIDLVFASVLSSGLRGLERAPLVGRWLRISRARTKEVLREYPGLERLAFFGVVAFILLPFAGTGAITGTLLARVIGLSRIASIGAVGLASACGAVTFALLAQFLGEQGERILRNPALLAAVIGLVACVGLAVGRRFAAELRRRA
jgi:uncharacterized membrane protein